MTDDPISRIEAALEANPTPGPWHYKEWGSEIVDSGVGSSQLLIAKVAVNTFRDQGRHNADFIAACNPTAIRTLLDRLKAAEAENERLRAELAESRTPTMFWDADAGSEGYLGFTLQEAVEDACDSMGRMDDPYELEVSCARALPGIKVRAWIDDKDNLQWDEVEDAAMRKEGDDADL